jgi:hypothetical protein
MPTINEVWEQALQINANLATIHNDITTLLTRVDQANQRLLGLEGIANAGFLAMADGIAGLEARQDLGNQLLAFQAEQQATIICLLEKISRHTCGTWNEAARQTALEVRIEGHAEALDHMFASSHADAALAYRRHLEDEAQIERCCPPEPDRPVCRDEPGCPAPKRPALENPKPFGGYRPPGGAELPGRAKKQG